MHNIARLRRRDFFPDTRTQIAVRQMPVQPDVGPHRHDFAELVIVLAGRAVHVTEGTRHRVQAGDVLFINSSRSHAYEETRGLNLANIMMREDLLREAEKELGSLPGYHALFTLEPMRWRQREFTSHLRLNGLDLRRVAGWLDSLKEETEKPAQGGRLLARCWLLLIAGLLARRYSKDAADSPHLEMRLGRVLSWIGQNFHGPVKVTDLALQAAMSERTFLRRFREATGFSPVDYVIRARIHHAMELLDNRPPGLLITEIASRCGFEDSNYFARQFRKLTGFTPRGYPLRK